MVGRCQTLSVVVTEYDVQNLIHSRSPEMATEPERVMVALLTFKTRKRSSSKKQMNRLCCTLKFRAMGCLVLIKAVTLTPGNGACVYDG